MKIPTILPQPLVPGLSTLDVFGQHLNSLGAVPLGLDAEAVHVVCPQALDPLRHDRELGVSSRGRYDWQPPEGCRVSK